MRRVQEYVLGRHMDDFVLYCIVCMCMGDPITLVAQ